MVILPSLFSISIRQLSYLLSHVSLLQEAGWTAADLKDNTGYSVMFGPDKCGSTNKVHFILRIKNPITGEYVEHHLNSPPFPINDKNTHVYTAVIKPKEEKVRIGTLLGPSTCF
jgi:hypothetical protein